MEAKTMGTQRLEAFTDGVIAIVITIMVLEIKVPHGATPEALLAILPILLTYVLSFINVGLFWNNHHHMLHAASRVDGKVLWANLFLLFCLSLVPFVIRWIDESDFSRCRRLLMVRSWQWRPLLTCCWSARSSTAMDPSRRWRQRSATISKARFHWVFTRLPLCSHFIGRGSPSLCTSQTQPHGFCPTGVSNR